MLTSNRCNITSRYVVLYQWLSKSGPSPTACSSSCCRRGTHKYAPVGNGTHQWSYLGKIQHGSLFIIVRHLLNCEAMGSWVCGLECRMPKELWELLFYIKASTRFYCLGMENIETLKNFYSTSSIVRRRQRQLFPWVSRGLSLTLCPSTSVVTHSAFNEPQQSIFILFIRAFVRYINRN